jgi:hypothetical protein
LAQNNDKNNNSKEIKLEFSRCQVFSEGLRLLKELDLRRTPLAKSVVMLATMSFFVPFVLEVPHRRSMGCSANPGW